MEDVSVKLPQNAERRRDLVDAFEVYLVDRLARGGVDCKGLMWVERAALLSMLAWLAEGTPAPEGAFNGHDQAG